MNWKLLEIYSGATRKWSLVFKNWIFKIRYIISYFYKFNFLYDLFKQIYSCLKISKNYFFSNISYKSFETVGILTTPFLLLIIILFFCQALMTWRRKLLKTISRFLVPFENLLAILFFPIDCHLMSRMGLDLRKGLHLIWR